MQIYRSPWPTQGGNNNYNDNLDDLVEQIWRDLGEQMPRARVYRAAAQVATRFERTSVTTFIPALIRHFTLEQLRRTELAEDRYQ